MPLIVSYNSIYIAFTDFKSTGGLYKLITFTMAGTNKDYVKFYFYGSSSNFNSYMENSWTENNHGIQIDMFILGF